MVSRYAVQQAKSKVIEDTIRQHFKANPLETFMGHIHTDEVIQAVRASLSSILGAKMTAFNRGEAFDFIREFGPEGEDDLHWMSLWGQHGTSEWSGGARSLAG